MGKQHVWVIISFCFPLFKIHGHWRRIYEKRLGECLNSLSTPYLEHKWREALEIDTAETIFKRSFVFIFVFNDAHKQCCFTVNVTMCHPELRQGSLPLLHECQACSDLEDCWFPGQQGTTSLTQHFHIWKQDCFINKEKDKGKVDIKKRNVIKKCWQIRSREHLRNFVELPLILAAHTKHPKKRGEMSSNWKMGSSFSRYQAESCHGMWNNTAIL